MSDKTKDNSDRHVSVLNASGQKTYISSNIIKTMDEIGDKAKYNAAVKQVLSDPQILAWILKYTVRELAKRSITEIISYIQGKPEISTIPVHPGTYAAPVEGIPTESTELSSQRVTYDIRFKVLIPALDNSEADAEPAEIIINIEAQNKFFENYDLVSRGVFYCARMLSSQVRNEESSCEYAHLKKAYSIWICLNVPQNSEYSITSFHMTREDLFGHMSSTANTRYDLIELIMVCLGRPEYAEKGTKLHQLLTTVLSDTLSPTKKKQIMQEDFDIVTSVALEGGYAQMCNLADGIEERGIQRGFNQGKLSVLFSLLQQNIITISKAAEEAGLSPEEFKTLYSKNQNM